MMRCFVDFVVVASLGVLPLVGCSDPESPDGTGGVNGTGGWGGGMVEIECNALPETCADGTMNPITPCCDLAAPPEQVNACIGVESLRNPTTCARTGSTLIHRLTVFKLADSCNDGYDLDGCDGWYCLPPLAPTTIPEGRNGVDNALAGLGPALEPMGANLGSFNQAFSDALCGLTDDCSRAIPRLEIRLEIDFNFAGSCANVKVLIGDSASNVILNLGNLVANSGTCARGSGGSGGAGGVDGDRCTTDADCAFPLACEGAVACASGTLGAVPLTISGVDAELAKTVVRFSVSELGLSHGLVGATLDEETALAIVGTALADADASVVVRQSMDIREDLSIDVACNAVSGAFVVAGVPDAMEGKGSSQLSRGARF